jgi:hypothetical protein
VQAMDFDTDPLAYAAASRPTKTTVIDLTSGERLTCAALDIAVERLSAWLGRQFSGTHPGSDELNPWPLPLDRRTVRSAR